jgi:hypothetical protein
MKLTLNTKYNINDTIYIAECYNGEFFPSRALTVYQIYTESSLYITEIYYYMYYYGEYVKFSESRCFGSYEECSKWCKEHN